MHREARDAERVQPGRDRHRLPPVRAPDAPFEIQFLHQETVGDDLVPRRRRHDEFAGRFVVGMIEHRQPLPRAIGPVLAEDRAFAVDVLDEAKPLAGHAAIRDRSVQLLAGNRLRRNRNVEAIGGMRERHRLPVDCDRFDRHAAVPCRRRQVERQFSHTLDEPERHRRFSVDAIGVVGDGETEHVVDHVHARLSRVGVRVTGGREESEQRNSSGEPGAHGLGV